MMRLTQGIGAAAALLALSTLTTPARADGPNWTDGPVVTSAYIRTVDGHFDDYMRYLSTTFKQTEEAAKKSRPDPELPCADHSTAWSSGA